MNEFLSKVNNNEYISNKLFQDVLSSNPSIIPNGFNLDSYNEIIIKNKYEMYKNYFENMYNNIDDNIHLDKEQIKAILAEEDYALIIAGAGTGKTTTMASKVKYLVDIKKVDPSKILVMSYTKKATEELEKRIVDDFNISAFVTTFHSLGYKYIKQIYSNRKCLVIDYNEKEQIFLDFFKELFKDKSQIKEIIELFSSVNMGNFFMFGNFFKENYDRYQTYDEFLRAYKDLKIKEALNVGLNKVINNWIKDKLKLENPITIKGEIVKSIGEAKIANFLFMNGIDYQYEEVYSEIMEDRSVYRPDFTLDLAGEKVYIEYFGMNEDKYNRLKTKKEEYHKMNNNKFISLSKIPDEQITDTLDRKLKEFGFIYNKKSDIEIYERILSNTPLAQLYPFKDAMYKCIDYIKSSQSRENYINIVKNYLSSLEGNEKDEVYNQFKYINMFYKFYQDKLYGAEDYKFDYTDLLYYANKYIDNISSSNSLNFEYIIIDEYQDISKDKYELAKKTASKNNAKVFAVGDDWQSIYAFNGSRIDYIYNFNKYFPGAKEFKINRTYRNSQELINYSSDFIMKNRNQIRKELISNKTLEKPVIFRYFNSDEYIQYNGLHYDGYQEYQCLKKVILDIHNENPKHNILVLARKYSQINKCFKDKDFQDDINTRIKFVGYDDINLEGMTIHKSKGLTFDEVIVIGLNKYFPSNDYHSFWLEGLFKLDKIDEGIPFAEERRLFYVALTRTKNHVYLIVDENPKNQSEFIKELDNIINKQSEIKN